MKAFGRLPSAVVVLASALWGAVGVAPAFAFNSYPPGAPHDQITRAACVASGWSKSAASEACAAVRRPDRRESRWNPSWSPTSWLRFRPNSQYQPAHHFDRAAGMTDQAAFAAGASFVQASVAEAVNHIQRHDRAAALTSLGSAWHALQDLHAHSNLVDMPKASADSVEAAVWDATVPPPASLRLTGYDASARDPEAPPGDPYPHGRFAKDSADKNDECRQRIGAQTKYELAKQLAIESMLACIRRIDAQVGGSIWRSLWE